MVPKYVNLQGRGDLADVITVRIWRWEIILDFLGRPNVLTRVLIKKMKVREGNVTTEAERHRRYGNIMWCQETRNSGLLSTLQKTTKWICP